MTDRSRKATSGGMAYEVGESEDPVLIEVVEDDQPSYRSFESGPVDPRPGPPVQLKGGKLPFLFISGVLTFLAFVSMRYMLYPWTYAPYSQAWFIWIYFHMYDHSNLL